MVFLKAIAALFMAIISAFNIFNGPNDAIIRPPSTENFEYLEYPAEAIINPVDIGLSTSQFTSRADDDGDELYVNAQGYQDINGIINSPYFTVHIERKKIPVYATTVFVGSTQKGALHSFCEIYVDTSKEINLSFQLNTHGFIINSVKILPSKLNTNPTFLNTTLNTTITQLGTYTFVFNDTDQEHGFTLHVKELVDEDKEIVALKAQYGENSVSVIEKGVYPMDYVSAVGGNKIIYYLRRGTYFIANHKFDIANDSENASKSEGSASAETGIGLKRYPFLNFNSCNTVKILGNGVFDLSHLDRGERRGIALTFSNDIEIRGVKFINPPEWCFITYRCSNVKIKDVDIYGYRQNSDAFAICNSQNVTVDNCFARSGDDLFDVKTLGGDANAISNNITFTNCIAWNGKARCFGICGEVNLPISNVTFKDCDVIFHDATWNADRIPALAIIVEQGGGSISNVTFENININRAYSRAIGCLIYDEANTIQNFHISGVKYKNVKYTSTKVNKIASNTKTTNSIQTEFENCYANGYKIDSVSSTFFEYDKYANITVK